MTQLPRSATPIRADHHTPDRPPPFETWPTVYGLRFVGDCCEPEITDGSSVIVDRSAPCGVGDFVAIWYVGRDGRIIASVKRLALTIVPWATFPYRPNGGTVSPAILCQRLNPSALVSFDAREVYGMHRVGGVAPPRPDIAIGATVAADDVRWFARPVLSAVDDLHRIMGSPNV